MPISEVSQKLSFKKKAVLMGLAAVLIVTGSLLQNNVLRVNAAVQVLLVSHTAIPFGTVFPGEVHAETYSVQLDTSESDAIYTTTLEPVAGKLNLCDLIDVVPIDDPPEGDTLEHAELMRPGDETDLWQVILNVPAIEGHVAQDHDGRIIVRGGDFECRIIIITEQIATRTQGFWQTHTAFTSSVFQANFPGGMPIGTAPHKGFITNIQSPGQSQLFGAYYASIPKKTTGKGKAGQRDDVDQARMRLLQQLVTAKLNCAAFECTALTQALIAEADQNYADGDISGMNTSASALDAYNNSADDEPIPAGLGSPGKATPQQSRSLADIVFWDQP